MVESRNIQRSDLTIPVDSSSLNVRLATVRLWDDSSEPRCSRFNVQLKLRNKEAEKHIDDDYLDGGKWTVFAHSDHNPNGGHDIRDQSDRKQLHVDVHPQITGAGYNNTYVKICDGSPPEDNSEAIRVVSKFMRSNAEKLLNEYLRYYRQTSFE